MNRSALAVLLGLALQALGCGSDTLPPEGQIRLFVTTDAPLPWPSDETRSFDDPPPLFDQVRIDLLEQDGSLCCSREFPLDRKIVDEGRASIGVIPPVGASGYGARVRLFRAADRLLDEPSPDATLDITVALPVIEAEGFVDVTVPLLVDTLGTRMGFPDPAAPTPGSPPSGLVGTWPGATRVPCPHAPIPGEVCIPGGAYWMGSPRTDGGLQYHPGGASDHQRLVVLSPFYLDAIETTVGMFRSFAQTSNDGDGKGDSLDDWCPATPAPGPNENLPLTCVPWNSAAGFCEFKGKRLPTEAELEYVAGGLESALYVWGDDDPECADAVFARAGFGVFEAQPGDCRPPGTMGGELPPGSGLRDRLNLPTGVVFDIAGNLFEMSGDLWNRQDEPCWSHPGIYVDPVCDQPSPADGTGHRCVGGAWPQAPASMRAASRAFVLFDGEFPVGFRCARAANAE